VGQLFGKYPLSRALATIAVAAVAFALVPVDSASAAYTFKRLYSFCRRTDCHDGARPLDRVVMDQAGNLYGTTQQGGKYTTQFASYGVVFKLIPNSDGSRYTEYVLHNFCRDFSCTDGSGPVAGVILDVDGNIYGTAQSGGLQDGGVIFKLTHGSNGWRLSVLKNFCEESNCADGAYPVTALSYAGQDSGKAWDKSSPLFGTTSQGGDYGNGVAYELTPNGSGWSFGRIHNFQNSAGPNEVLVDSSGNIWGTTATGGKYGGGLMYKLANGSWSQTVLHNFCNTRNCADGNQPVGRLAMDASGNLFGATFQGGNNSNNDVCFGTCGVVFERTSGGTYSVVYNFCAQANCTDGASPAAGVIIDGSGSLFGTTSAGGANSQNAPAGTVYELSGGAESVLHSFCSQQSCADGRNPQSAVIFDSSGGVLGTTYGDLGEVFRLGP